MDTVDLSRQLAQLSTMTMAPPKEEDFRSPMPVTREEVLPQGVKPAHDELSFEIIALYAKKGCKKCYGRGHQIYDNTVKRVASYCPCVIKGLIKAEKQAHGKAK